MFSFSASKIKKCKAGDQKCLAETITNVLSSYPSGIPEIGLASIDPLHFDEGSISQEHGSQVSLNLTITNGDIFGWKKMQVKEVM